jgi:hydroxyacylglutathione hydrolase
MITLKQFVFNELEVNGFLLYDETGKCLIVDPGCNRPGQQQQLSRFVQDHDLKPEAIVLTHGHFDHLSGLAWAKATYSCPVLMHPDDLFLLNSAEQHAGLFGLRVDTPPQPDRFVEEGEVIPFGNSEVAILHVPGHSPGSICLYSEKDGLLICGDVLFSGSVGRSDLFGGDHALLIRGIKEKLMVLPRETTVWPGHGPKTTIGTEYDTNPFLN